MTVKVLLADDHAMVRDGLRALLEKDASLEVVAAVSDGVQALEEAIRLAPDIVILDVQMPRMDGISVAKALNDRLPQAAILMLSMQADPAAIYEALASGARGYLLKNDATAELREALAALLLGRQYLSKAIDDLAVSEYLSGKKDAGPLHRLSPRERNILQLVVEGRTNAEAAEILSLSVKTVETYRSRMMSKLRIDDVASLVKFALRNGLTQL